MIATFGRIAVALCFFMCAERVYAQPARPNVYMSFTGDDAVGRRLSYELREQIANSPMLTLTDDPDAAFFRIYLSTISSESESYSRTSYSMVITLKNYAGGFDYYFHHYVGYCGASLIQGCAQDLLVRVVSARDVAIDALGPELRARRDQ